MLILGSILGISILGSASHISHAFCHRFFGLALLGLTQSSWAHNPPKATVASEHGGMAEVPSVLYWGGTRSWSLC